MGKRSFLAFTGTNDRATFALNRAFEACEANYSLVARNHSDRIFRSRFRERVRATRSSDELSLAILEEALDTVRRAVPDDILVLVPNSEYLNNFLLGIDRADLLGRLGCSIPLVDRDLYLEFSNKLTSSQRFAAAGIRVPARHSSFQPENLPMVAKPIRNVGLDGCVRYPWLLRSNADLDAFLEREDPREFFAQEFIAGRSEYLLAYISRSGEAFVGSQVNLAQQPHGKSIVLAATSSFHEHPVALSAIALLREAGFHGLAMIEFIVDAQGPCFIEMNPRPWGPLQLCLDHRCGIVEAFIGDALDDDPHRFAEQWKRRPAEGRYLWLGGIIQVLRRKEALRWSNEAGSHARQILRSLSSDVYLRRDSWKVFLKEILDA